MNTQLAKEALNFLSKDISNKIFKLLESELSRVKFCTYRLAPDRSNFAKQFDEYTKNSEIHFISNSDKIQMSYVSKDGILYYVDMPDIFFDNFELFLKQNKQEIENNNVLEFRKYKEFKEARIRDEIRKEQEEFQTYLRLKAKYEGTR